MNTRSFNPLGALLLSAWAMGSQGIPELPSPARPPYIDVSPTLARIMKDAQDIALLEVQTINAEKHAIIYKKVSDLKGHSAVNSLRCHFPGTFRYGDAFEWLDETEVGERVVTFFSVQDASSVALVSTGRSWYVTSHAEGDWWNVFGSRPEMELAFSGSIPLLARSIEAMLAGKEAQITTGVHGVNGQGAFFDVVFGSTRRPLQRIRASLSMPDQVYLMSANPEFLVGPGPAGREDLPALRRSLKDADPHVRREAADTLGHLGSLALDVVGDLSSCLKDPDPRTRLRASEALLRLEPHLPQALVILLSGLEDRDSAIRAAACRSMATVRPEAGRAIPALSRCLNDKSPLVRRAAARALGEWGPPAQEAVPALIKFLSVPELRQAAIEALGRIGPKAKEALPALEPILGEKDAFLRLAGARAMARIGGPGCHAAIPVLVEGLKSGDSREFYDATFYLAILGPEGAAAIPDLEAAHERERELTAMALWAIEPTKKFPWQMGYEADRDCDRWFFQNYLRVLGPRSKIAALALSEALLADRAGTMPHYAVLLLQKEADSVLPSLISALKSPEGEVRRRAAETLAKMGPSAKQAARALNEALRDKSPEVRTAAGLALGAIGK